MSTTHVEKTKTLLASRGWPAVAVLLALLLAVPGLFIGLLVDDLFQNALLRGAPFTTEYFGSPLAMFDFVNGDPEHTQALMDVGFLPWWTFKEARFTFLRPVSVLTHLIDYRLWPTSPFMMHLHGMAWMGTLIALVYLLYRRIHGSGWVAGLAVLLYAVDDAHAIPSIWIANRNAVIAAVFGMITVLLHEHWRRVARESVLHDKCGNCNYLAAFLAPGTLLLSVLSNEGGIATCAFLFAYAVCLDGGGWVKRLITLVPYGVVILAWRACYTAYGFGVFGSEVYVDPGDTPLKFMGVLAERAPVLLLGQWLFPLIDVHLFMPRTVQIILLTSALLFITLLFAMIYPLLRRSAEARFWVVAMLLATVPASTTFLMGRMLLFIGIAAMGLLAALTAYVHEQAGANIQRTRWQRTTRTVVALLLLIHLVGGPLLYPANIALFYSLGRPMATCIEDVEFDNTIREKTFICVNTPMIFYTSYLLPTLSVQGKPLPKQVRSLAPNTGFPTPIRLTRSDAHTIVVRGAKGYPLYNVRSLKYPLNIGDAVRLEGVTITVQALTDNGWPQDVAFSFDVSLEDPSLVWTQVQNDSFVPFTPPKVGDSISFNM